MDLSSEQQADLYRMLERMGALGCDERPPLVALPGGVSSLIVRADTRRGAICVKQALARLKVEQPWFAPVERNSAELAWLRAVAVIAPDAVPQVVGEDREARAFAMHYLAPDLYPSWKAQLLEGIVEPATARRVGMILAAIHCATARRADVAAEFANDATFFAIRLEPYLLATARAHPDCAAALEALAQTTAHTKLALMHGDVSPKNILIGPGGPVFLDAECACYGDPAFDLAFCLNHLMLKCVWRASAQAGYLACFDALAHAYLGAIDWEDPQDMEARTARLLPGLMLARIDGKSPIEYVTDARDKEHVRNFSKRTLRHPCKRLAQLREMWKEAR